MNTPSALKLLTLAVSMTVSFTAASEGGCTGNGCNFITVTLRDGCINLANSHQSRAIKVYGQRAIPTYVWTVYAQSVQPASIPAGCMSNWYSQGHVAELQ